MNLMKYLDGHDVELGVLDLIAMAVIGSLIMLTIWAFFVLCWALEGLGGV